MENEAKILAASIKSREAYEKLLSYGTIDDLSEQGKLVWKQIEDYYNTDKNTEIVDRETIKARLVASHPKHGDLMASFIDNLPDVSVPNLLKDLLLFKIDAVRNKLSIAFATGNDAEITELLEQYNAYRNGVLEEEDSGIVLHNISATDLVKRTSEESRIKLLPSVLNNYLDGGVLKQHHIVIFAPTEMGKSLFSLNMAYGFIKQGLKVLYIGNEDPGDSMLERFFCRITGMVKQEIRSNPEEADLIAFSRNYDNFIFVELSPGTPSQIRKYMDEWSPDVLMVDQIRNLNMRMGKAGRVQELEAAARFVREMGKSYNCVAVSITQAADSATGKAILGRGDIDSSNVGIPGTADLMIGIGATEDMEEQGLRMLSLVKNKVGGLHEQIRVVFDPKLTKVS